jgi:hypothetical protein
MSKHNRTEVIKLLKQEMEAATDPQAKVEFAKQLAKLLPRPRQAKRPRKPNQAGQQRKNRSLRDLYTGSVFDEMSDGKLVLHYLVLQIEKRQRKTGELRTKAERDAFVAEVMGSLPKDERAAFEALK